MRFVVNRETFLEPLSRVCSIVDSGTSVMPILSSVYISSQGKGLSLTGSNIDIEINEFIPDIDVPEAGTILFSAERLLEFCRKQPTGSEIEIITEDDKIRIQRGEHSVLNANTLDADDFPMMDVGADEWSVSFDVERSDLLKNLKRIQHAMAVDDYRSYLNGALFEIENGVFRTVATDAHRLAVSESEIDLEIGERKHRALLPRRTILELMKVVSSLSSSVNIKIKDSHVDVTADNLSFASKLLEHTYPDWRGAVPVNLDKTIGIDRQEFASALSRINILSAETRERKIPVNIKVEDSNMLVRGQSEQTLSPQKIRENLLVKHSGDKVEFNAVCKYLLDSLETMPDSDEVEMSVRSQTQGNACILKFPDDASAIFIVMLLKDK